MCLRNYKRSKISYLPQWVSQQQCSTEHTTLYTPHLDLQICMNRDTRGTCPKHTSGSSFPFTQPTLRPLHLSMSAVWTMSISANICTSPNISLSLENTRSAAAELGVNAPTICIASAQVGKSLLLFAHQSRMPAVNLSTSVWSNIVPAHFVR